MVGAYREASNAIGVDGDQNNNSAANAGAVYVFARSGTTWNQQAYLTASNTQANDYFADSVAVSGDTIVVGATQPEAGGAGAVYVFAPDCTAPTIADQPDPVTVCAGASASFSVTATGTSLTYQWRKGGFPLTNGSNISGADTAMLTINPASASDDASYDVVVTGSCGTVTSSVASLTVNEPPMISSYPVSQTKCIGEAHTFSVTASGTGLNYQWRKNGAPF